MIGTTIGHYRIEAELGRGGMGVVYRSRDETLGRDVALKVVRPDAQLDPHARERLIREARTASQLNHPHICTIYEAGEADGQVYVAMELISGQSLAAIPPDGLPTETVVRYAAQIADALAHAHAQGVVHRDLKPGNVVITADGRAKVLDFGLARLLPQQELDAATRSQLSAAGAGEMAGTLAYMAPEQLRGEPADARSDIWALGLVLYEMATGHRAFSGPSGYELSARILREPPPPLTGHVSPGLARVIQRCLAKDPAQRYQHASEVRAALETIATDTAESPRMPGARPAPQRFLRPFLFLLGPLLAVGLLLGILRNEWSTWLGVGSPEQPVNSLAVLPLKTVGSAAGDDYLGLGIADTVITRVSQVGAVTVRPSSAVRKYATQEMDALQAARELKVDAVLDGTLQRSGDRLRVNLNLLRAHDGASLWSETFNVSMADIFDMQDQIAQRVAAGLRLKLTPAEQERLSKRYTSNPQAYENFLRGEQSFDRRGLTGRPVIETAIQQYHRATELDPNYALAHSQLAYAYTWMALFADPDEPSWRVRAEAALQRAEALDPSLAETHLVRYELFWSVYGGFNIEAGIRELRKAQELNPRVGHHQLGILYAHMGLEKASARELGKSLELDPASQAKQSWFVEAFDLTGKPDEAIAAFAKLENAENAGTFMRKSFMWKEQFDKAEQVIRRDLVRNPGDPLARSNLALLTALHGDFAKAEAEMPELIRRSRRSRAFHHMAYNMASIYALQGKTAQAVDWLRKTAEAGMPNYTLFERDPHLNRIRRDPAFVTFMNDLRPQWESYQREFGQ